MSVFFEKKRIVVPGEVLADAKFRSGSGTYRDADVIRASVVGLPEIRNNYILVIPLQGAYISKITINVNP